MIGLLLALALLFLSLWLACSTARPTGPLPNKTEWRVFGPASLLLLAFFLVAIARLYVEGNWLFGPADQSGLDFAAFFAAARVSVFDTPSHAYSLAYLEPMLQHVTGRPWAVIAPFFYPPMLLLLIQPLAMAPYAMAAGLWIVWSVILFVLAGFTIWRRPWVLAILLSAPAAWYGAHQAQTSLLVAALMMLGLSQRQTRPICAGICFGLLIIKPQFGVLIPLLLLLTRNGRCFLSASITVIAFTTLSWFVLGPESFSMFFFRLQKAYEILLVQGANGWQQLQSIYSAARHAGLPHGTARLLHGLFGLSFVAGAVWLWCQRTLPETLKSAALPIAALAVTPYVFIYDYTLLLAALVFILADSERYPLRGREWALFFAAFLLPLLRLLGPYNLGPMMLLLAAALLYSRSKLRVPLDA